MGRGRTGRRPACLVLLVATLACATLSIPEERRLGQRFEEEVRSQLTFVNDRVVVGYVERIGAEILRAAGPQPFEYRFFVIEDEEINAFAGPAGHVYFHTGTLLKARNVSEFAGVVAHEVGHVVKRHVAQNYSKQQAAGLGRQLLVVGAGILGGRGAAGLADLGGGLTAMLVLNKFGREAEREADVFALRVLPAAGYDPNGMLTFFETLRREGGANVPGFLSSHPTTAERIAAARQALAAQRLPAGLRVDDGGRLEIIQRRIRVLTGMSAPMSYR